MTKSAPVPAKAAKHETTPINKYQDAASAVGAGGTALGKDDAAAKPQAQASAPAGNAAPNENAAQGDYAGQARQYRAAAPPSVEERVEALERWCERLAKKLAIHGISAELDAETATEDEEEEVGLDKDSE